MNSVVIIATVAQLTAHTSPGQPWSIETTAHLVDTSGQTHTIELPGGTLGDTTVIVSHQPTIDPGTTYTFELVQTLDGYRALSATPLIAPLPYDQPQAYVLAGSAWPTPVIGPPFALSVDTFPASIDDDELTDAFVEGIEVWNRQGGAKVLLSWEPYTDDSSYGDGSNGINTTTWDTWHWGSTLGISVRTVVGDEIRDCDIRFYGSNNNGTITWNVDPSGAPDGENALRHTLVHEAGHCIGISHSELDYALMAAYAPDAQGPDSWRLHLDDQAAVQAIYGVATPDLSLDAHRLVGDELELDIVNTGDWDAWDVTVSLDGDLLSADDDGFVGNIPLGEPTTVVLSVSAADCGTDTLTIDLVDGQGAEFTATASIELDCNDLPGDESPGGGCGCSGAPVGAGWLALVPALWLRRRERR